MKHLSAALAHCDGNAVVDLAKVYQDYGSQPNFLAETIRLLAIEPCQIDASWLLKHYFENGGVVTSEQATTILNSLSQLVSWESKLNLLQSLASIPITKDKKAGVEAFLRSHLSHENKFVRAWTYNGFYLLAKQYSEYQAEALQFFEMAMQDESASVKARIRNVMKKGF